MRNITDKRFFKRLKTTTLSIEYKVQSSGNIYSADVINISAGGICFLRTSILAKGEIIQVKFPFKTKKIILTGDVIRIEGRETAVKFLDDESQIEKFVEYFNMEYLGPKAKMYNSMDSKNEIEINTTKDDLNDFFDET